MVNPGYTGNNEGEICHLSNTINRTLLDLGMETDNSLVSALTKEISGRWHLTHNDKVQNHNQSLDCIYEFAELSAQMDRYAHTESEMISRLDAVVQQGLALEQELQELQADWAELGQRWTAARDRVISLRYDLTSN